MCWQSDNPWTARRSNQSILKEISPGCSLEGLMLKLKLQYFGHLMRRADSLERPWSWERLRAGREGDDRGWDGWLASLTQWTWVWVESGSWWWTGRPGVLRFMGLQRVGHDWATELNWTELVYLYITEFHLKSTIHSFIHSLHTYSALYLSRTMCSCIFPKVIGPTVISSIFTTI